MDVQGKKTCNVMTVQSINVLVNLWEVNYKINISI